MLTCNIQYKSLSDVSTVRSEEHENHRPDRACTCPKITNRTCKLLRDIQFFQQVTVPRYGVKLASSQVKGAYVRYLFPDFGDQDDFNPRHESHGSFSFDVIPITCSALNNQFAVWANQERHDDCLTAAASTKIWTHYRRGYYS